MDPTPPGTRAATGWSTTLCGVAIAGVAWVVWAGVPTLGAAVPPELSPEAAAYMSHWDSAGQRHAHRAVVALVAAGVAWFTWGPLLLGPRSEATARRLLTWGMPLLLLWGVLASMRIPWLAMPAAAGTVLLAFWALGSLARVPVPARLPRLPAALLLVGLLAGLVLPVDMSCGFDDLEILELHYAVVVGPGRKLAHGYTLFDQIDIRYGFLGAGLLAGWERFVSSPDARGYVRMVQLTQPALVATFAAVYWQQARGRWWLAAVPTVLVATMFHTASVGVMTPNQAGWRFGLFALGVLALAAMGRHPPDRRAAVLGAVGMLGFLHNIETAVVLGAGVWTYLWFREGWWALPAARIGRTVGFGALGAASAGLGFAVMWRVGLGSWPGLLELKNVVDFAGGYGGSRLLTSPFLLVMIAHPAAILFSVAASRRVASHRVGLRAAASAMILVWLAYYANRPHPYNVSLYVALYGIVLVDDLRWLGRARRRVGERAFAVAALFFVAILPAVAAPAADGVGRGVRMMALAALRGPAAPDAEKVSGLWLRGPEARGVVARAARLPDPRAWYLTDNVLLLPLLTDAYNPVPISSPFAMVATSQDHRDMVDRIARDGPPILLVDDAEAGPSGSDESRAWFQRLLVDLAPSYREVERADAWIVLARLE